MDNVLILGWGTPIGIGIFLLCLGGFMLCLGGFIYLLAKAQKLKE
ncbi:hypothetical protein DGWBC_1431 [Dehalogenimonas sp. WBC-2]|nr:hypothetical protein DGWBC_1431 [Dehalogenimonas sp. WBC-2]